MTKETRQSVIRIAYELAEEWFPSQLEADVPDLDPDGAWVELNELFQDNAAESIDRPTAMDHLFETAYRQQMARLWLAELEKRMVEVTK